MSSKLPSVNTALWLLTLKPFSAELLPDDAVTQQEKGTPHTAGNQALLKFAGSPCLKTFVAFVRKSFCLQTERLWTIGCEGEQHQTLCIHLTWSIGNTCVNKLTRFYDRSLLKVLRLSLCQVRADRGVG